MWRMTKAAMTAAVFRRGLRATFKAGGMFMGVRMKHVLKAWAHGEVFPGEWGFPSEKITSLHQFIP